MFEIPDKAEVKDFGFTVYDAETGDSVTTTFPDNIPGFVFWVIAENGCLYKLWMQSGSRVMRFDYFEKEGKYIIQFSDGRYMRY